MDFVGRAQWGAPPTTPAAALPTARGVAVHWVGDSYAARDHAHCPAYVRGIRAAHLSHPTEGWADIAYNLLACQHGSVYEGRGAQRRSGANGRAAANSSHYAVCALWGADSGPAPPALLGGIRDAIDYLRARGAGAEITGHRDHVPTACPGEEMYEWAHRGAPRPEPADHDSEDDMPQRTLYGTTDGYRLEVPAGEWRQLTFDRVYESGDGWREKAAEPSVVFGPCFYSSTVAVRASGLKRGQELQIRLAHYRRTEDDAGWERTGGMPISSPVHDGGSLHAVHAWQSHISGTRRGRVRVEVQHFGHEPVVIDYARAETFYWSIR